MTVLTYIGIALSLLVAVAQISLLVEIGALHRKLLNTPVKGNEDLTQKLAALRGRVVPGLDIGHNLFVSTSCVACRQVLRTIFLDCGSFGEITLHFVDADSPELIQKELHAYGKITENFRIMSSARMFSGMDIATVPLLVEVNNQGEIEEAHLILSAEDLRSLAPYIINPRYKEKYDPEAYANNV